MKQLNIYFILAFAAIISFSCEDDKDLAVINPSDATPSSLLTPADGSSHELNMAEADGNFQAFTWSAADYGVDIARKYRLEMDKNSDLSDPEKLAAGGELLYEMTVAELNLMMYDLAYEPGVGGDVYFRVYTTTETESLDTLFSAINKVNIKTFDYTKPDFISPFDGDNILLLEKDEDLFPDPVVWEEVDFGADYSTLYAIEFDYPGNNFADPVQLVSKLTKAEYTATIGDWNELFVENGVEPDKFTALEFRIVASVSSSSGLVYGETITLNVSPYSVENGGGEEPPTSLYLVGNATLAGWDNTQGVEVVWDENNSIYSVVTDFIDGGIKILEVSGQWAPQWGDDGTFTGKLSYRPDEATADPAEIPSPGTGTYKMTIDIDNLTYAFEAQ